MKNKVLVTGACGFIGSHLVEELLNTGYDVKAFVHYNSMGSWGWLDKSDDHVKKNIEIYYPIKEMMGDNAAMIAWACMKFYKKDRNDLFFKPMPRLEVRSVL